MSDAELTNAPPVPISEHSRVLVAMHRAMRADSQRLISAVDTLPAGDTQEAALGLRRHRRPDPRSPLDRGRRHVPLPAGAGAHL